MAEISMRVQAHAKINWALNVCSRRADGYHILDMLVQRIALHDVLELRNADELILKVKDSPEGLANQDNLVIRAAHALKKASRYPGGALIHLEKHIPSMAGLGGGSADAAAALAGLNRLWGLGYSLAQLQDLGEKLGADVPLCLGQGLMRVRGIGEKVEQLPAAPQFHLLLLQSHKGLSTAEVFRHHKLQPDKEPADMELAAAALMRADIAGIRSACKNQLQPTAAALLPEIRQAFAALEGRGAGFAQMTGSGSAVFGLFETKEAAEKARKELDPAWPTCIQTTTLAH